MLNRLKPPMSRGASPVSLAPPWCPPKNPKILIQNAVVPASLEERPPKQPARAPPRRVHCFCQNEVEKIRRAYCLNPKSFGLMKDLEQEIKKRKTHFSMQKESAGK